MINFIPMFEMVGTTARSVETVWYFAEWIIRIGAILIVPQRRSPDAARAWLLLIFFLPIPGLGLFLLIGSPRFPPWRKKRFEALTPIVEQTIKDLRAYRPQLGDRQPVADLAERLGRLPPTCGNKVELIDDYDEMIDRLVGDIAQARRYVHLLVYIFADDRVGRKVCAALADATARGVRVRVMFDPVGSHRWRKAARRLLVASGAEVREALPWRLFRFRSRRDMRNHRKLFIIDGLVGYAGSQNIVAKDFRQGIVNRELVARVSGPVVSELAMIAAMDWQLESDAPRMEPVPVPDPDGDADVQLLPSGADYRAQGFETLLVWLLHQARQRAILVAPYFIPDADLLGALRTAVARGVQVDIVLSRVVDQRLVNLSQRSYYDALLAAGVVIHLYRDQLLHAKNVSIDSELAIVGSSNVDLRSFQLNEEASLLFFDRKTIDQVRSVQQRYLLVSETLEINEWRRRAYWCRTLENIARLFNSLL